MPGKSGFIRRDLPVLHRMKTGIIHSIVISVVGLSTIITLLYPRSRAELPAEIAQEEGAQEQIHGYQVPRNVVVPAPPRQPLDFSHKVHAGELGLPCQTCHAGARPERLTANMSLPETQTCMSCHQGMVAGKASMQKLPGFHQSGEQVPWVRIYQVLEGVNWSHRPHLQSGIACESCHQDVRQMEIMTQVTAVTAMATCISCHASHSAPVGCETCHAWPGQEQILRWRD